MTNRIGGAAALAVLLALTGGLSGCALSSLTNSSAATASKTYTAPRPATVAGTWVYRDAKTVETLHLAQGKHGAVSGDGKAIDKGNKGKVGHTSIHVNKGKLTGGKLSLEIYLQPLDWGNGLTLVEYLTCTPSARALTCRMSAPLYPNIRNVPQTFARH